jgi:hypothetical protein
MANRPIGNVLYEHKRAKHATRCMCPFGGPDGRQKISLPAGTIRCPATACRGELKQVNTGARVVGKNERRLYEQARLSR